MTTPAGKFAPKCAKPGCDAWASWGYGCTKEIGSGTWFCFAHRPSDEAKAVPIDQAQPAPAPIPKQFAGGLF